MSLADVDATLARLGVAIDVMTANLLELEADPTNKLLDPASLTGTTRDQVAAARRTLSSLWEHFTELKDLADRARKLRGNGGHVPQARVEELEALLHGPSIALPPIDVPLAERGLYTPGQTPVATTPDQLLTSMAEAFESAKHVIVAVDRIWRAVVPRLEAARGGLAAAEALAATLGEDGRSLDRTRELVDTLGQRVGNDPLAVNTAELDRAEADLSTVRARLDQLARDRDALDRDLAAGTETIEEIAALIDAGAAAIDLTRAKIANPDGLLAPLDRSCLTDPERGLTAWLERLRQLAGGGDWRGACRGIDRWEQVAADTLAAARQVEQANGAPVQARNELRGRLDALAAKAERLGLTEDPELAAVREQAQAILYTAPTDLPLAAELVAHYGASLSGTTHETPR
jgi:hypothetical protein